MKFALLEQLNGKEAPSGFDTDIEKETVNNTDYRRVLFTAPNTQLVLMSLKPGEEIGVETHDSGSQFIRFEAGEGKVTMGEKETKVKDGSAVVIPQGVKHNVVNTSETDDLKLYALYSPPEHPEGTVHKDKEDEKE